MAIALPLRLPETGEPYVAAVGAARLANGLPVTAGVLVLVTLAFPLLLTPPTTCTLAAVTLALPLASTALAESESTTTLPAVSISALPESESAPPAAACSATTARRSSSSTARAGSGGGASSA